MRYGKPRKQNRRLNEYSRTGREKEIEKEEQESKRVTEHVKMNKKAKERK